MVVISRRDTDDIAQLSVSWQRGALSAGFAPQKQPVIVRSRWRRWSGRKLWRASGHTEDDAGVDVKDIVDTAGNG